ncbi:type VII toxin-antitoxin system HepT family RNase toxin [Parafrankia sp. FMc2]|uniref:type VII toxin-antitoxin system HepT family RNase toxin n=1 Tax=Parafrankia sp. FMc2 TaxID=3233196 RepID=UPI0034D3AAB1
MVDEARVLRLLRAVTDDLSVLRREADADDERRADPIWLRGVKYTFVTAIEACVDVAQHICATEGWGPPADNGDAVRLLGAHGVLDPVLAQSLRKAVGFRNVLVHDYVDVDDGIVITRLKNLGDLADFVRGIARHVSGPDTWRSR